MPSFFGGVRGTTSATLFEIRLENDVIVLRGSENEASSQLLKGVVVLCLPAPLKVEDVHLRMTGTAKLGWTDARLTASGASSNRVERTTEIFSHRFPAFVGGEEHGKGSSSKGLTLNATNYEFPFELVIPGSSPESVEGLSDTSIMYKLKATVARGKFAYDLHAYKPVRIIRTLDPAALELSHAMAVENVWPNKIEYSLVIPQKAIMFGTAIDLDMRFTSLLKGLRIGTIKCNLVETQEFVIPGLKDHVHERSHKYARDIGSWSFELNEEEHYRDILNDEGQDGYTLKETLPLPKSLRKCLQDVETNGIKIRHKVKFNIALHNPDGHVSELRATLPVTIFISPNMALDESGDLLDQTPNHTESLDVNTHAPPLYGEHVLDQLYADIDLSGMTTPAPASGMATPMYSQSRRGSSENLPSMSMDSIANTAIRPDALSSRLQNLESRNNGFVRRPYGHGSGGNTPRILHEDDGLHHGHSSSTSTRNSLFPTHSDHQSTEHSIAGSAPRSNPLSRRTSEEDHDHAGAVQSGAHTPEHVDFVELADLSKVPSYTTAVRTPMRGMSYSDLSALPDYDTAMSAPPSPDLHARVATPGTRLQPIPDDGDGYFDGFSGGHSGSTTPSMDLGRRSHQSSNPTTLASMRAGNSGQGSDASRSDASRRLHLMQVRGRAH